MIRIFRIGLLCAVMVMPAWADGPTETPVDGDSNLDLGAMMAKLGGGPGDAKSKDKQFPPFEKVTDGMEAHKGMLTLWTYPKGAKGKDGEKVLCQVPGAMMGTNFMLSKSFSGGGFFTGFPLDERVVKWEVLDRQLLLIEPQTSFIVDKSQAVADVVKRTYPERIRVAVPIVTKAPNGDPVFDFGQLLKSGFADIGWMTMGFGPFGGMGGGGINARLSKFLKRKVFDLNVEASVELAVRAASPPGSYDKKIVHYSFWKLPKSAYKPRVADDRVGYFLTTNQDWAKPTNARDLFNRYIDRWYLEKRDSSLKLCEPKQPIVYYIEKTVPVRFRRAVRDGILEWNKAFETVGFLNAVEVRQQTDDNEWKDLDPEDMRYSFFRWIVAGAGFAMGPHRANPFTGQIYDADIIFDDAMVRFFERSAQRMLPAEAMTLKVQDPALEAFVERFPEWKRPVNDWTEWSNGEDQVAQAQLALRDRMRRQGKQCCEYSEGMKHQMAYARTVLAEAPPEVMDDFLYDVIKEVVMHEVGHTLGLRHNFKASTVYTLDEIKQRRKSGEATTGSVMDYNPVLFTKDHRTAGEYITTVLGPYDFWAIEYGYRPFDGKYKPTGTAAKADDADAETEGDKPADDEAKNEPAPELAGGISLDDIPAELLEQMPPEAREMLAKLQSGLVTDAPAGNGAPRKSDNGPAAKPVTGETGMLASIASRATEPQLVYATDEDTTMLSPDPRSNRFDASADPIDWAEEQMAIVNERMDSLLDWAVKDHESWYHLRSAYQSLLMQRLRVLDYVGRYIGGQYFNRAHRGDPNAGAPFELVDAQMQRRAMKFIADTLFDDAYFKTDPMILNHLAPSRWSHAGTSVSVSMDYPVHGVIGMAQWWVLFDRLLPETLRRIHDAELKSATADRFTLAEYMQGLRSSVWSAATDAKRLQKGEWSDQRPFVSGIRRSLQREYLNLVEPLVRYQPGMVISPDIHAMLTYTLRDLSAQLNTVKDNENLDFASRAHVLACQSRIERMLEPELKEYGMRGY